MLKRNDLTGCHRPQWIRMAAREGGHLHSWKNGSVFGVEVGAQIGFGYVS
jgi:hypothetical protein